MSARRLGSLAVGALLLVAGCGGGAPSSAVAPVTLTATISNGEVAVDDVRAVVDRDAEVTIVVTSDAAAEVHVHGYDRYIRLTEPGTGSTTFVAHLPGVFEVETHDTGLLLFQLEVR